MLQSLEEYSTIALYSAMAVYAIAFIFYVVDLANRSGDPAPIAADGNTPAKRSRSLNIGFSLTVLGFVLHA
ncbi:MAG: c-type cytochrome biogenesis protein CcsB, partial [Microbacteriaceae bacterium]|nr:c-type cytochrome biogenesis protein CcsB [Microbacteriaceae bacterium]